MTLVIPVFIPHEGCAHRCLFCNQHSLSGQSPPVGGPEVAATIALWLDRCRPERRRQVQVAFYGGSFTCLEPERQEELLGPVQPFLDRGVVHGIRLSTRPDCIDERSLDRLARSRVQIIELGAQSCDDAVLARAGRGHDSAAVILAAGLVRARGFRLGIEEHVARFEAQHDDYNAIMASALLEMSTYVPGGEGGARGAGRRSPTLSKFTEEMYATALSSPYGQVTGEPDAPVRHSWGQVHAVARRMAGALAEAGIGGLRLHHHLEARRVPLLGDGHDLSLRGGITSFPERAGTCLARP